MRDQDLTPNTAAPDPAATFPTGRGVKIALAVSVALNLVIVGLVAGAMVKDAAFAGRGPGSMGLGVFTEAFSRDDRRALRKALAAEAPSFRATRASAEAEYAALIAALRAEPFDEIAVKAALSRIAAATVTQLQLGREVIEAHLLAMPTADRLAFAKRLETRLDRRK